MQNYKIFQVFHDYTDIIPYIEICDPENLQSQRFKILLP